MKTALLVIDIQNDYFPGGRMEVEGSPAASLKAKVLLELFRARQLPIVHIRHISNRPGATFFLPGTEGTDIHPNAAPLSGEPVIVKNFPNSFRDTELLPILRDKGIERLVVCGMMTHMCVDATVRAAFDHGLACIVAHDACATRALSFNGVETPAPQVQAAFLAALGAVYGRVVSSAEAAAEI
ncbi:MAG: cysteine hydrolase [Geobacter sp.]|nr:cysteine hydrolase [Geobacter sp.]